MRNILVFAVAIAAADFVASSPVRADPEHAAGGPI
jgi:hypothetical protein